MELSKTLISSTYSREEAEQFVTDLKYEVLRHRAIEHPYLQSLADGDFLNPTAAIHEFTFQYLCYSNDFLRYLAALLAQLEHRKHRELVMRNLMEESGQVDNEDAEILLEIGINPEWVKGVTHPKLYTNFLDAIGRDEHYRATTPFCDEAIVWRNTFLLCCSNGGAAQALGAMGLGTECIVKYIYKPVVKSIERFCNISAEQRVFFDLHATLDDKHGETLLGIATDYARYEFNRAAIRNGMLMALNLRAAFFDSMFMRTKTMQSGNF